jgi:hypothetical protein
MVFIRFFNSLCEVIIVGLPIFMVLHLTTRSQQLDFGNAGPPIVELSRHLYRAAGKPQLWFVLFCNSTFSRSIMMLYFPFKLVSVLF